MTDVALGDGGLEARARTRADAVDRKRGDERALRLAAGLDRRPGGPTRAHVDKVDPLLSDDALQASHVERHRERVFGRRREANEEAADRLQFAGEPARNRSPPAPARRFPRAPRSRRASPVRRRPQRAAGRSGGSYGRRAARSPRARTERARPGSRPASPRTRERDADELTSRRGLRQARFALRAHAEPSRRGRRRRHQQRA